MTFTDKTPAPEIHGPQCIEWCNHCAMCGVGIAWGARCRQHYGVYSLAPADPRPHNTRTDVDKLS